MQRVRYSSRPEFILAVSEGFAGVKACKFKHAFFNGVGVSLCGFWKRFFQQQSTSVPKLSDVVSVSRIVWVIGAISKKSITLANQTFQHDFYIVSAEA